MSFMQSYKRLDKICRDMNGIGITGYIEDMEKKAYNGKFYVFGWKDDYYTLKHYRYIRNRIAHEYDAEEENMCSLDDEKWLNDFYERIMRQDDPLALYRKATQKEIHQHQPDHQPINNQRNNTSSQGCYIATAIYGSYNCPQVWVLRRYRDNVLANTYGGRAFIKVYYAISPSLVKWFGKTQMFKKIWRIGLDRIVNKLKAKGFESGPYNDK